MGLPQEASQLQGELLKDSADPKRGGPPQSGSQAPQSSQPGLTQSQEAVGSSHSKGGS